MDKKAVICDDDRGMTIVLKHLLAKQGFEVYTASDGEEGLDLIRAERPALIVLDLEMPVKDGFQVLREMKTGGLSPYVIVLSAHESKEKRELALSLGAREMRIKPFNPAEFAQSIEHLTEAGKL